jgi:hypothetical protein
MAGCRLVSYHVSGVPRFEDMRVVTQTASGRCVHRASCVGLGSAAGMGPAADRQAAASAQPLPAPSPPSLGCSCSLLSLLVAPVVGVRVAPSPEWGVENRGTGNRKRKRR